MVQPSNKRLVTESSVGGHVLTQITSPGATKDALDGAIGTQISTPGTPAATVLSAAIATATAGKLDTSVAAATYATPASVGAQVSPLVADAIAADGTVVDAAAAAVTAEIADRDMIESRERLSLEGTEGGFIDPNGNIAEGGAYDAEGRIPYWVLKRVANRMGVVLGTPRIACWGTSMTWGQGGYGVTYPGELQALLDDPVFNMGVGGNWSRHVAARQNGAPAMVTVTGGVIPASGAVNVITSIDFMIGTGSATYRTGSLAGIPGVIKRVSAIGDPGGSANATFTRSTAGTATQVKTAVPWYSDEADKIRSDIAILEIGRNDLKKVGASPAEYVRNLQAMIDYLTPTTKRVLVLEITPWSDEPFGAAQRTDPNNLDAYNVAAQAAFPHLYVPSASWLQTDAAAAYAGITWTAQDLTDIANGITPVSFRDDGGHYNAAGYKAFAYRIYKELEARGWVMGRFIKVQSVFGDDTLDKAQEIYAADTFDRGDGAPDLTPVGRFAWTPSDARTWAIDAGTVRPTTVLAGTMGSLYITDPNTDGVLSVKLVDLGTTGVMNGLVFRGQSDGAAYLFYGPEAGVYSLRKRAAGGTLSNLQASTIAPAANDVISVQLEGSRIICKVNGVTAVDVVDTSFNGARKGVWVYQTSGTALRRFDDFSWNALP